MRTINEDIKEAGFIPVNYSKRNDAVILFTSFERDDNNRFVSIITNAIKSLHGRGKKITPTNMRIETKLPKKEIELNMQQIENIMDALGID